MKKRTTIDVMPPFKALYAAMEEEINPKDEQQADGLKNYRKAALKHYTREIGGVHVNVCVVCGFGIQAILEVAHLDQVRANNNLDNLAVLCPNCHKMQDIGLFPDGLIRQMRDHKPKEDWKLRIKDAGKKAALTRQAKAAKQKRSAAATKAAATRQKKQASSPVE
jgi:hypothetical protein